MNSIQMTINEFYSVIVCNEISSLADGLIPCAEPTCIDC